MPQGGDTFQVPYVPADARTRLLARLTNLTNPALRRRYRLLIEFGAPLFPPDEQIALDAAQRGRLLDGLQRWLHLPPAKRQFDLLILPDVDYFWPANLQLGSNQPLYSTAFILHMEPSMDGKTTVHMLQINSTARFGKRFDLLGRTGPKFYWDDRPVPPSPQAARELIEHLTGASR
ncbi:hypothetical protein ACZ75_06740 [Massilia sp. NR 4-1]|nr:hypothetical protein ACZ75_06740 [Massilia sp. NR 4-1]